MLAGLSFAIAARAQFREGRSPLGRELRLVALFESIIVLPLALYFYGAHADWAFEYRIDPARLPAGSVLGVPLCVFASGAAGYALGWLLIRRRGVKSPYTACVGVGLVLLVTLIAGADRLSHDGTFASFRRGEAQPILETKLAWAIVISLAGAAVAASLVVRALREEARRRALPSPPPVRRR